MAPGATWPGERPVAWSPGAILSAVFAETEARRAPGRTRDRFVVQLTELGEARRRRGTGAGSSAGDGWSRCAILAAALAVTERDYRRWPHAHRAEYERQLEALRRDCPDRAPSPSTAAAG